METIQPLLLLLVTLGLLLIGGSLVWPAPKMTDYAHYVQCMSPETREDLRTVMREGVNNAMRNHTGRMFDNWMRDATDQPGRAVTGMHNAVKAYVGSLKVLNDWNPPQC